ncbi:MAG TPA: uroporphyrinogen decarboxylase family protein [Dehalococcoidia bacterium]|nr:uroporphyrinogen decarboxylase family protein [Dehalococcoidia bacterium]
MGRGLGTGASFISPRQYQKFVEPWLKRMVDEVIGEGITPVLHFDADWTPFLPFLRDLPAKKCIFAPDQVTDLFKAKEILGDHMCLMGNVSPQVLALGTVDETVAECKRLIDVVGKGGGFILSSGCEVPFNARPENVAAMVDTAKTYFPH